MHDNNTRPIMPHTARMLDARWYIDTDIFTQEQVCLFRNRWQFVVHDSELPNRGDYVCFVVDGDDLFAVRGEDGVVRVFHNLCRHRGTRLIDGLRGTLTTASVQCPYHAWTYGLDGRLRAAPGMDKTEGFERTAHGLHSVATDSWDGHVFMHLGTSPKPLLPVLDDLPAKLGAWGMGELVPVHREAYSVAANWKMLIQNYSECLHCPVAHPQLQALSHYLSGENDPPHETYLGGRMDLRPESQSLTTTGAPLAASLPGLSSAQRRIVAYYAVLPNLLLNLHPDYMLTFRLQPRSPGQTDVDCTWYVHPETRDTPGFDPSPAVAFWDLTNRQDWSLCERAQRGVSSSAYQPGPYSNREDLLWAFDQWLLDKVGPAFR